jgi:glycosyltransferase involved in cell wall biosynthesis
MRSSSSPSALTTGSLGSALLIAQERVAAATLTGGMARVLVISNDYVNRQRAGPAIRAYELSRELVEAGHEVTLAVPGPSDIEDAPMRLPVYDAEALRALAPGHDVAVFQGWVLERYPFLREAVPSLVVDLYDPFPLELLVTISREPTERRLRERLEALLCLNEQIRLGDFFMCASQKQLDFWLGAFSTLNRVNPETYAWDPSLRRLISVVPFGIPAEAPARRGPGPRETVPGIGPDDLLLLWGGGVYNWFDPLTLIRGVAQAARDLPNLRLLFMAAAHPNPDVPEMWMLTEARRLSAELGLTGRHVFFNEDWVPYDSRADWLLDADIGVSTHFDHVETRFSFRTRVLDYFWAGLPVISTEGDTLADRVASLGLGAVVPAEDPAAVAHGILGLAEPAARAQVARRVREHAAALTWKEAARPLVAFCSQPAAAPDLAGGRQPVPLRPDAAAEPVAAADELRAGLTRRVARVWAEEGLTGVVRRTGRRLRPGA